MVRFCLEGRRPPAKQDWPGCLASYGDELREILDTQAEF
jgi:hypothetical protein